MTIQHHLGDDLLASYAAGGTDEATGLLVATHLALCPACRTAVAAFEAVGGAIMAGCEPADLNDGAFAALEARLGRAEPGSSVPPASPAPAFAPAALSAAAPAIPQPLRSYLVGPLDRLRWQRVGPGVRRVPLRVGGGATARLLELAPGLKLPRHGHTASELTLVLSGGYSDESGRFARGDVEEATPEDVHRPITDPDGPCLCLVVTTGALRFTGLTARLLQPFIRL